MQKQSRIYIYALTRRSLLPALACLLFLLLSVWGFSQPGEPPTEQTVEQRVVRTVHQIHILSNAEARQAYPVELDGVVIYSDPEWGLLFVRDETGSVYINVHGSKATYRLGTRVRVEGVTGPGDAQPIVAHPRIHVLGSGRAPVAEPRSVAELDSGEADSSWVVTEGILHPCEPIWNRVCYRIFDGKKLVWLVAPQLDSPAAQRLIGAKVRVRGVSALHFNAANKRVAAQLFVNTLNDIKVEEAGLAESSAPQTIDSVSAASAAQRFERPVHVRGTVTWESPKLFALQSGTSTIFVEAVKGAGVQAGKMVDVVGFPALSPYGLALADAVTQPSAVAQSPIAPLASDAAELIKSSLNGHRVRLRARLLSQDANPTEFTYELQDGKQRFKARLLRREATREVVGLERDAVMELTGVAVVQSATAHEPGSLLVLIESPADMEVLGVRSWLTLKMGLVILGAMALCVCIPMIWVSMLRRTVRKQTSIIRSQLENELHLETRYRRLFERNLAAVFTWRADGVILDCNMAFVRLLGFERCEEVIGRSYWEFDLDPERRREVLSDEVLSNRHASLLCADGSTLHLLKNITPVVTAEGIVYETTAIDVTRIKQNEAELQRARDAAVYESLNDPLTGLPNRRLLTDTLRQMLDSARGEASMVALLYIDLDGFKLVNDSLGHPIGDGLLVQVAGCLRGWVSEGNMLGRMGGDEFLMILDKLDSREEATRIAEELLAAISNPLWVEGHVLAIGASIGISIFPDNATNAEELMQHADSAMYAAKREGKNRALQFTPEIGSLVQERLKLENQLRGAVGRGEIYVHYQPEFNVADRRLVRFEALARWNHPTLGKIPPVKFIPIAEECGMISALGMYIMELACMEALRWQGLSSHPIQVAVNVSSIQFRRSGFVEEVCGILERTGLRPELLQIELTESVMLSGTLRISQIMNRLRRMGISLAIDDFGTGYSSLSYLPSLPFDSLKIDASFIRNLGIQPESESMIRTLISLAHNFGMRVIVEGVETQKQLELIQALGAHELQGFLLGKPTADPIDFIQEPVAAD
jgi:diguanylate cyclase (GGDEF)-like protein/PAS domain S-box-containing protein